MQIIEEPFDLMHEMNFQKPKTISQNSKEKVEMSHTSGHLGDIAASSLYVDPTLKMHSCE